MIESSNIVTNRLERCVLKLEKRLKETGESAVYHWRTDEDDRQDFIKVFFEIQDAKKEFEMHKEKMGDISSLEIYSMNSKIRDEYDSITTSIKVRQDILKLIKSFDMPFAEDKLNFFADILPKEKNINYGDESDCFMENQGVNEEYILREAEFGQQ